MRELVYLIGAPGIGKSTALAALTNHLIPETFRTPFGHTVWWGAEAPVAELGVRRASFSGTDTLPMNVQPKVVDWLANTTFENVLGEGDRLANGKFFCAASDLGWNLTLVWLRGECGPARRSARAAELGVKEQDDKWVRGRETKVARLAEEWPVVALDADAPAADVAAALRAVDVPPIRLVASAA